MRDCDGKVCGTFQASLPTTLTPFEAEALAFLHAAIFCKDSGFYRLIFGGDAVQVINQADDRGMTGVKRI